MQNLLTIIIPTYNRCDFLDYSLKHLSEYNKKYLFSLIICDNASNDRTCEVVEKWRSTFKDIKYIRQKTNLGYTKNVSDGYFSVRTPYCWVLGDAYTFNEDTLSEIFQILELQHPTAIIINNESNALQDAPEYYSNVEDIVSTIGWYLTLLCSCIISSNFINETVIKRYTDTRFLHFGICIDALCFRDNFVVRCAKKGYVYCINIGKNKSPKERISWQQTPFKVFAEGWFSFVMSLPNTISLNTKLKCILDHNKHTHFFHPLRILLMRMKRYISYKDYWKCRKYMRWVTSYPTFIYDIIYFSPPVPIKFLEWLQNLKWMKTIKKKILEKYKR